VWNICTGLDRAFSSLFSSSGWDDEFDIASKQKIGEMGGEVGVLLHLWDSGVGPGP